MSISPCINICKLIDGVCVGCNRTIEQITEWEHYKDSENYGKKTNSKLFFMGINHVELNDDGVIREWVLFDEVAIWKQILMSGN